MHALAEPPRTVPRKLQLAMFIRAGDAAMAIGSAIAAWLLILAASMAKAPRVAMALLGSLLLLIVAKAIVNSLRRSRRELRFMRDGFFTVGRIASCHLAYDSKKKDMPYADFLADWVVQVAKAQVHKAMGLGTVLIALVTVIPFGFGVLVFSAVFVLGLIGVVEIDHASMVFLGQWVGGVLLMLVVIGFAVLLGNEPLPADNVKTELLCQVDYRVAGAAGLRSLVLRECRAT